MKYRPSKSFIWSMAALCPLSVSLWLGLLPGVREMEARAVPGELVMPDAVPTVDGKKPASSGLLTGMGFRWSMDWLEESYEDLVSWEHNPWKRKPDQFGHHYFNLIMSKDPKDQAKVRELRRLAEAWHKRLLARYPDLAVPMRNVPDDRNGYLKWLEFCERMEEGKTKGSVKIPFPAELETYLNNGNWNQDAARTWLAENKALLDEIRAIGLMPESSVNGIPAERWEFTSSRLAKNMVDALFIEARLAADTGNVSGAMESMVAAKGLASHLVDVETPSLLAGTVKMLLDFNISRRVLDEILPTLPAGQVDVAAWERMVDPGPVGTAEFAHLMRGEWSVGSRIYLLPMLLNQEDPKLPRDGGALLDVYSMWFAGNARSHDTAKPSDIPQLSWQGIPDTRHLSRGSNDAVSTVFIGANSWRTGWERAQSVHAMNAAAFAILKGQPVPKDPVYGQDYRWDPQTRVLAPPDTEAFRGMKIDPVKVPRL